MMVAPPSVLDVAELVAARAEAGYQIGQWAGIPSRTAHRQVDRFLGRIADVEDLLTADTVIRWGR